MRLFLLGCLVAVVAGPAGAQQYFVNWSVIPEGGGLARGQTYNLGHSIGQTVSGWMHGQTWNLHMGFWQDDTFVVAVSEPAGATLLEGLVTALGGVSPVPCREFANVEYAVASHMPVRIEVYNTVGRSVRTLIDTDVRPGKYSVAWDCTASGGVPVARGVYFVSMFTPEKQERRKVVVAR